MINLKPSTALSRGALGVASLFVIASCGGGSSDTARQRNSALPTMIPVQHERSTVCTNFYGVYQKDMSANGAEVTLRFCPDATRYVLTWEDGAKIVGQVTPQSDQVKISGQDFISKGLLNVAVHRDLFSEDGQNLMGSIALGDYSLTTQNMDGKVFLKGSWNADGYRLALQPLPVTAMPLYLAHVFDQIVWYSRERCRAEMPSSESEAFNLQMSYQSLQRSFLGWMGSTSIDAKNARSTLAERRMVFRALNMFQVSISGTSLDSEEAYVFNTDCKGEVAPYAPDITEENLLAMKSAAPALRDAMRAFDASLVAGSHYSAKASELILKIRETVPEAAWWRLSGEPDKGALEAAHLRLHFFSEVGPVVGGDLLGLYGKGRQSWGQQVWTDAQIDNYLNPTTTSTSPPTSVVVQGSEAPTPTSVVDQGSEAPSATSVVNQGAGESKSVTEAVPALPGVPAASALKAPVYMRVGSQLPTKTVAVLSGLSQKKGQAVRVTVQKKSQKNCKVSRSKLMGMRAGQCGMRVSLVKGKKVFASAMLTLEVAAR